MDCRALIVDTSGEVAPSLTGKLRDHDIVLAESDGEAVRSFRPGAYCCVIINHRPPKLDALYLVRLLRSVDPKVGLVITTRPEDRVKVDAKVDGTGVYAVVVLGSSTLPEKITEACEYAQMSHEQEEAAAHEIDTAVKGLRETRHAMLGDTRMVSPDEMDRYLGRIG